MRRNSQILLELDKSAGTSIVPTVKNSDRLPMLRRCQHHFFEHALAKRTSFLFPTGSSSISIYSSLYTNHISHYFKYIYCTKRFLFYFKLAYVTNVRWSNYSYKQFLEVTKLGTKAVYVTSDLKISIQGSYIYIRNPKAIELILKPNRAVT